MATPRDFSYYVYQLRVIDEDKPFYVGKGCNKRIEAHFSNGSLSIRSFKNTKIKKALSEGKVIVREFLKYGICEDDAYMWEVFYIAHYGRRDINTGCLTNLTDGGDGVVGYKDASDRMKLNNPCRNQSTREKIANSLRGRKSTMSKEKRIMLIERMTGENHPNYGRRGECAFAYGYRHTIEHRNRITGEGNPFYGKRHDEETRKLMSSKTSGKNHPNYGCLPWENNAVKNNIKILNIWSMSQEIYELYHDNVSWKEISEICNVSHISKTIRDKMIGGWKPIEDTDWIEFKEKFNGIEK